MSVCYLNGTFQPLASAQVSVLDRGFMFGDGVYEVIPVYSGQPFRLLQHLRRLQESLAAVHLPEPLAPAAWAALLEELIARNGGGDVSLYLQVTRGPAFPRDHLFPEPPNPTVFAMVTARVRREPEPVAVVTLEDIRWRYCNVKSTALLANVLLRQQAREAGAYEAVLLREGWLTEGAASNVFVVAGGRVRTPPRSERILSGITRDVVIEVLKGTALAVEEVEISAGELAAADEIWLTSSTREIVPVVQIDGVNVGPGTPGAAWREALACYRRAL